MKKTILASILLSLFLGGCASSGYKDFYKSYANQQQIEEMKTDSRVIYLKDNEEPKIYSSGDLKKDMQILRSRKYYPIGYSSFNGGFEGEEQVKAQAKKIGAVLAIYGWKYTNSQTNSGALVLPKTNYHSGTVYGSSGGYASYSGTSTGTTVIPYSNTQRRYDQEAIFFVHTTYKYEFGTSGSEEITREKRIEIGHNGIMVNVIIEKSPAYKSDLLVGDIIIKINNNSIKDYKHFSTLSQNCVDKKGECLVTVIRDSEHKDIKINF
jgi:hypothetical protein